MYFNSQISLTVLLVICLRKLVLYDDLAYILLRIETGTQKVGKSVLMGIFLKVIEISWLQIHKTAKISSDKI